MHRSICARGSRAPLRDGTVRGPAPDPNPAGSVVLSARSWAWAGERGRRASALEHDERGSHVVGVREGQMDAPDATPGGEASGAAVEPDAGAAGRLTENLDVGPPAALPAVAGPHRLEERLLGSEARRERALRHGDPEAVGELVGCEQPAESALAATLAEPPEAGDRNEVDSRADDHG